ncbi:MAG: S8 family serine peptidase [Pseudomonadota bacterium]
MNRWLTTLVLLVAAPLAYGDNETDVAATLAATEWIVVLEDPRPARQTGWSSGQGYRTRRPYNLDRRLDRLARELAKQFSLTVVDQWPLRSLDVHCVVVQAAVNDPESVLRALIDDARVRWVQPYQEFDGASLGLRSNDEPLADLQHAYRRLNLPALDAMDGSGSRIVLIDSAVDPAHPELADAVEAREDFVTRGPKISKRTGEHHGTGMAAVIAANARNAEGIAGIAPGAKLFALRACWEVDGARARCDTLSLSLAIEHAASLSPHVLNLSLTGPPDQLLERLLDRLVDAGTIVVAAFDETRAVNKRFPLQRTGVVIARNGSSVQLPAAAGYFALANDVPTALPGEAYGTMSGHSIAAAHLSGAVALLAARYGPAGSDQLLRALEQSTVVKDDGVSVDVCAAVNRLDADANCGPPSIRNAERNHGTGAGGI